jgi:putative flippase GtrA
VTTVLGAGGSGAGEQTAGVRDRTVPQVGSPAVAGAAAGNGAAATPAAAPDPQVGSGVVGRVSALVDRARGAFGVLYREMLKFGVVGAVAFVVDIGLFNLLSTDLWPFGTNPPLDGHEKIAKVISATAATLVAWLGNRHWSFRHRRQASAHRELLLFGVMNVGGMLIAVACLTVSHDLLGFTSTLADNISGNIIGIGLGTLFRFWTYRRFVFTEFNDPAAHGLTAAAHAPDPAAVTDLTAATRPVDPALGTDSPAA